jgi:pyruvate/oxaloacetate carboxyltransferase
VGYCAIPHIATEAYRELRSYVHERNVVQRQKSETLTRIQRLLTLMNIKLQHHVSDIEGVGAMNVLRAIASGTQEAETLVSLMHAEHFKASREELVASLEGNYRPHFVAMLKMKLEEYDFFVSQMKK